MPRTTERKHSVISTNSLLLIVVILLLVVIIILLLGDGLWFGMMNGISGMMGANMFGGMMNGGYSSMMNSVGAGSRGTSISIGTAESYADVLPQNVQRYSNNNTLVFSSSNVTLVVLAMGVQRAVNLTHRQPPEYDSNSSGNAFVIYGLINPTLIMPKDAIVHVEFINLDSSEYHNVIMTATGPPYQYMPMSVMYGIVSMMPIIPHANYPDGSASEYNYTATFGNSGTYWYICMYPGHAQMGMYGEIIVK